ncbi:hypothetical protein DFH28DRAFT_893176 [Melampsora americana]|nr:hypothetical protein DFH28DRAFT_893176 [Melampsora americana]
MNRVGTRMQQRSKKHLRDKQRALKDKYNIFCRNVEKFNQDYPSPNLIECPSLEDILRMSLADHFWDIGQLTHPHEAWAVDRHTQDGIQAYLEATHSEDEVRRVGRECRQAVKWALDRQEKLSAFSTSLELQDNDTETVVNKWLVSLVSLSVASPIDRLNISKSVLKAVYSHMSRDHARLCMVWNIKMGDLMKKTRVYSQLSEAEENLIEMRWSALARESKQVWKSATEFDIVDANPLDEDEVIEQNFCDLEINEHEDGDEDGFGQPEEVNFIDIEGDGDGANEVD